MRTRSWLFLFAASLFHGLVVAQTVSIPTLLEPANLATDQPLRVTLKWTEAGGASDYEYEVDAADSVVISELTGGATNATVTLTENTTYSWRVRGMTSETNGPWSVSFTFTTRPPIPAPVLIAPAQGEKSTSLSVTLQWGQAGGATAYDYEVYREGVLISGGPNGSAKKVSLTFVDFGNYSWRVRGKTSLRVGTWSEFSTFTIRPPLTVPLLAIASGDSGSLVCRWASTTGWTYQLQLTDSLVESGWGNVGEPVVGTGEVVETALIPAASQQFFRLAVQ